MMNVQVAFLAAATVVIFTSSVTANKPNFINMGPHAEISDHRVRKDLGVVKNVRSCGGQGKVLQWRYQPCLKSDHICQIPIPTNGKLNIGQIDFIPSRDIRKPALRYVFENTLTKTSQVVENPFFIWNQRVLKRGNVYTLTALGSPTSAMSGKFGTFRYVFYEMNTNRVEFCVEAVFKFM